MGIDRMTSGLKENQILEIENKIMESAQNLIGMPMIYNLFTEIGFFYLQKKKKTKLKNFERGTY